MKEQTLISAKDNYRKLDECLLKDNIKRLLLVCGNSIRHLNISDYFSSLEKRLGIQVMRFSEFEPNPQYESVVAGIRLFQDEHCDGIMAVGGGSAIDVAKCIKLYYGMDENINYLEQIPIPNDIPLYAAPTTAGTGSEATRYAVIYYNGIKQSVSDDSIIPSVVLFDESFLISLPIYQKKSTMLDALCHGIESFWSVNSTNESKRYSEEAIKSILNNKDGYLANIPESSKQMLLAAYTAGKAINITQTTAGHAMCYKLTSLYGYAHGHSAALCLEKLWPFMLEHLDQCNDSRGTEYLKNMFSSLSSIFDGATAIAGAEKFSSFFSCLNLERPICHSEEDYELLRISVNPVRLKNNPIFLKPEQIYELYHKIIKEK